MENIFIYLGTTAAADTFGLKNAYQGRNITKPWWMEAAKNEVKDKMRRFKKWMKSRTP